MIATFSSNCPLHEERHSTIEQEPTQLKVMKRSRPPHNYDDGTKRLCLAKVGVGPERKLPNKVSAYSFCNTKGTPHPTTIYRWKREKNKPPSPSDEIPMLSRPPKLSIVERYVIGGWVLERDAEHEIASGEAVCSFIADSFHEQVSLSWVSRTMASLHLTSHREAVKKQKYRQPGIARALHTFLNELRETIDNEYEASQVVAVDNVRFTHPSPILRSYGPQGGYVPALV